MIVPLAFDRAALILPGFGFQGVGRLKPGVTIAQASADVARLVPIWMTSWPAATGVNPRVYEQWRIAPALRPLKEDVVGNVASVLWVLMGTIGIVMLIACANVASLLLVRAEARQQELAVRAALGAGRGRIVRALLIESVLLGLLGGVLGVALARPACACCSRRSREPAAPARDRARRAARSRSRSSISLLSGLLFGLIPAVKYAGAAASPRSCAAADARRARARSVIARATCWSSRRWRWRSCCWSAPG